MQKTITCIHCRDVVPTNPCLKGDQDYCNKKACQNARKRSWYQTKIDSAPEYAKRQKECKKRWRKNKPAHKYQNHYRQTHPEYVENNRQKQQQRNRKRRLSNNKDASQKIVKIDTLALSDEKPNIYEMKILTPNVSKKIVKIDALIVQLQAIRGIETEYDS